MSRPTGSKPSVCEGGYVRFDIGWRRLQARQGDMEELARFGLTRRLRLRDWGTGEAPGGECRGLGSSRTFWRAEKNQMRVMRSRKHARQLGSSRETHTACRADVVTTQWLGVGKTAARCPPALFTKPPHPHLSSSGPRMGETWARMPSTCDPGPSSKRASRVPWLLRDAARILRRRRGCEKSRERQQVVTEAT